MSKEQEILKKNAGSEISDGELEKVAGGLWKDDSTEREIERRRLEKELELKKQLDAQKQQLEQLEKESERLKQDMEDYTHSFD